jgi:ribosomal protein L16 Arg81 hydroxylase
MTETLSRILSPLDAGCFLKHYGTRQPLHVARTAPDYYADVLSEADLDAILQSPQLPAAFVNVVKEGTRYAIEDWSRIYTSARGEQRVAIPERLFGLYGEGATLILNQADRTVPSLNAACRALSLEMGFPAQANVYITPRNAMGFSRHEDDHEVMILQIAGSKRWLLFPQGVPGAEIDLRSGDLLYLPRGLAHSAQAQEADSIHVTVGLRPWYAFQLIEELAAMASQNGGFQQPVPPRFADDGAKQGFESAFLRQLQDLIAATKPSELIERRFHSLVENQPRGWSGRLSDLRYLRDITPETVVRRRPGILTIVKDDGKTLNVEFAGTRIAIPSFLKGALEKIMSQPAFAVRELEGFISNTGKEKLITEFVRAGFLRIVNI